MEMSEEFNSRRETLITQIFGAFDGVSRGDGVTLHQANVRDNYGSAMEEEAARELDQENRWQDVPEKDVPLCQSALSFLDEVGFRYYLPVFMIYGLRHWGNDAGDALGSCQFHLTRETSKSLRKSEPPAIAKKYGFTAEQVKVIAAFLRFVVDFDDSKASQVEKEAVVKWESL